MTGTPSRSSISAFLNGEHAVFCNQLIYFLGTLISGDCQMIYMVYNVQSIYIYIFTWYTYALGPLGVYTIPWNHGSEEMAQIWIMLRLELFTVPRGEDPGKHLALFVWFFVLESETILSRRISKENLYNVMWIGDMIQLDSVSFLFQQFLDSKKLKSIQNPAWNWPSIKKYHTFPKCQSLRDFFWQLPRCSKTFVWDKMAKNEEENDAKSLGGFPVDPMVFQGFADSTGSVRGDFHHQKRRWKMMFLIQN